MSVPELEARLRRLKLAEPPADLGKDVLAAMAEALSLRRQFRMAWGTAAAAALLVVAVSWREPARPHATPATEIPQELVALDPTLPFKMRLGALAQASSRRQALSENPRTLAAFEAGEGDMP